MCFIKGCNPSFRHNKKFQRPLLFNLNESQFYFCCSSNCDYNKVTESNQSHRFSKYYIDGYQNIVALESNFGWIVCLDVIEYDGKLCLVIGSWNKAIEVWDLQKKTQLRRH